MIAQAESIISGYFQLLKHGQLNSKYLLSLIQARFGGQGLGVGSGSWFAHPFFLPSQHGSGESGGPHSAGALLSAGSRGEG